MKVNSPSQNFRVLFYHYQPRHVTEINSAYGFGDEPLTCVNLRVQGVYIRVRKVRENPLPWVLYLSFKLCLESALHLPVGKFEHNNDRKKHHGKALENAAQILTALGAQNVVQYVVRMDSFSLLLLEMFSSLLPGIAKNAICNRFGTQYKT